MIFQHFSMICDFFVFCIRFFYDFVIFGCDIFVISRKVYEKNQ